MGSARMPPLGQQLDVLPQICPSIFTPAPRGGFSSSWSLGRKQCPLNHGYTEWAKYQPISRFGPSGGSKVDGGPCCASR